MGELPPQGGGGGRVRFAAPGECRSRARPRTAGSAVAVGVPRLPGRFPLRRGGAGARSDRGSPCGRARAPRYQGLHLEASARRSAGSGDIPGRRCGECGCPALQPELRSTQSSVGRGHGRSGGRIRGGAGAGGAMDGPSPRNPSRTPTSWLPTTPSGRSPSDRWPAPVWPCSCWLWARHARPSSPPTCHCSGGRCGCRGFLPGSSPCGPARSMPINPGSCGAVGYRSRRDPRGRRTVAGAAL